VVKATIEEVKLAWTDNGLKMFNVLFVREDGSRWVNRTPARDELDAYNMTTKYLAEEEQAS
jgi:hypothetical protein